MRVTCAKQCRNEGAFVSRQGSGAEPTSQQTVFSFRAPTCPLHPGWVSREAGWQWCERESVVLFSQHSGRAREVLSTILEG